VFFCKLILTLLLFVFLPVSSIAANEDAAAVAALAQMIASTGWNPAALLTDAVVSATVTPASGVSSAVTFKVRGLAQYRSEIQRGSSVQSMIVNNRQAAKILADGSIQLLGLQDAVSNWAVEAPVFSTLPIAASAQNLSITYLGTDSVNGTSCNRVQITAQSRSQPQLWSPVLDLGGGVYAVPV
jgi:hypothetical protein